MDSNHFISLFQYEMLKNGINPPQEIIADGQIHRFYIEGDKANSKNGWYLLYLDGVPSGVFGSWKKGQHWKWSAKNKNHMNTAEQKQQIDKIKDALKRRHLLKIKEQQEAALKAEDILFECYRANPNYPYLVKKRIFPFYAHQSGKNIVLPIVDLQRKLWSLQFISETGEKIFLSDGAIKSHFIPIQGFPDDGRKILITEGFATGATLAMKYPDYCVTAACNSGNLKHVAMKIRQTFPNAELVICADDDRLNPENPGIKKGREAAILARALFSKPTWPEDAPMFLKDFNDLECWLADKEVHHA